MLCVMRVLDEFELREATKARRNPSFGPGTKDKGVVRLRAKRKPVS
jgi:hypothetical protein